MNNTQTPVAEKRSQRRSERTQPLFRAFFIDELKDIYWAEKHSIKGEAKIAGAATCKRLIAHLEQHVHIHSQQLAWLEQIFEALGCKPAAKKCDAMEGLLKETDSVIEDTEKDSFVRNAALILCAQKIEHYKIAHYGTLRALSGYLPECRIREQLGWLVDAAKERDARLTEIAENFVNEAAAEE